LAVSLNVDKELIRPTEETIKYYRNTVNIGKISGKKRYQPNVNQ
jgi:hypothetical protein